MGRIRPLIIAHRGASFDAPENTMASFNLAWEQGADAIEGDFCISADGEVIALHDATFKRTAGVDKTPQELTLKQIRALEVGSWKDGRFHGERVPTLYEILVSLPANKQFLIEAKCGPEIIPILSRVITSSGVSMAQLRLISFDESVIVESKKQIPQLGAYWLTSFTSDADQIGIQRPTLAEILTTLVQINADGVDAKADMGVVDDQFVNSIKNRGFEVHFWTVDDPRIAKRLASIGADSITTNRPAFIRESLAYR